MPTREAVEGFRSGLIADSSMEESSPVAIGQAMAAGLPVVAVDIPGVRHLVQEGSTGCLVREPNPAAMADSLVSLVQDEKTAFAMGAEGRRQATRRFMPAAVARQTRDLYMRILEEDGRVPHSYSAPRSEGLS
jgi:glycosyltransferase involved in cell wall biosynthesis